MKTQALVTGLALGLAAFLFGCGFGWDHAAVRGSGKLAKETRTVPEFREINVDGAAKIDVTIGSPRSVVVEADDNIIPLIETEVRGDRLVISAKQRYHDPMHHGVTVTITTPQLTGLEVRGAVTGAVAGLAGDRFDMEIRGAGTLKADGAVDELQIDVAGAGSIDGEKLRAKRADVSVAGAGEVTVTATDELMARVSGVGTIRYGGNPGKVQQKVLGVGRIAPI